MVTTLKNVQATDAASPADELFLRSDTARQSGYSIAMLAELEEAGLLKPIRLANGTRLYSRQQIKWLQQRRAKNRRAAKSRG